MKKYLAFFLVLIGLFSCRREQAFFQKSQPIVYEASPKKTILQTPVKNVMVDEVASTSLKEELPAASSVLSQTADSQLETIKESALINEDIIKRKGRFLRKAVRAERKLNEKIESIGSKKIFKSEKRKGSFLDDINSKIKIGVVFLAIAIVLGLVGLKWVAIIFAIAAVLYLAWGLKRVFR
jgi:hypothetical protein